MLKRIFLSEWKMLAAILLNSIVIFLLYFPQIEKNYETLYSVLENIDHFFVLIFLIEAIVKLRHFGIKGYFKDRWNVFDFFIVIVSLPSLMTFIPFFVNHNFSFVKILRLFRMIRLLKIVQFIPRMKSILDGLGRALKASVFVIIALVVLNFLIALFTCHFYGEMVPEYFGDPLISSYYIFQMFTIEGWNEIPLAVAKATKAEGFENAAIIAGATRFYFILVVLFGGIFGMSLANAIFVDEMTMDNNKVLEDKIDKLILKINKIEKRQKRK